MFNSYQTVIGGLHIMTSHYKMLLLLRVLATQPSCWLNASCWQQKAQHWHLRKPHICMFSLVPVQVIAGLKSIVTKMT